MSIYDDFPDLQSSPHRIISPRSQLYNCIAWAANDSQRWWWPDPHGAYYWPTDVPRDETISAFLEAYATLGFTPCNDSAVEQGVRKIALYAKSQKPTHAARQLLNGNWTSKLGSLEDIEHTLDAIEGVEYGVVVKILSKPRGG